MRLPITAQFDATGSSIPGARRLVGSTLDTWGVDVETQADLVLAVSELVANAVAYGAGDVVHVRLAEAGGSIELRVTNVMSPGATVPFHPPMPPPDSRGGRGLALVHLLADRVVTSEDHDCFAISMFRRWR